MKLLLLLFTYSEKKCTWDKLSYPFGEGNVNPLQCSCPENPGDGGPGGLPSMGPHRVGHD